MKAVSAAFFLAWRYVLRHGWQSLLLALALGMVLALPLAVRLLVRAAETEMRSRALSTPALLGRPGSAADLLLGALYFSQLDLPTLPFGEVTTLRETRLGQPIPLHLHFKAQKAPIIGTTLDYFDFRHLRIAEGRPLTRLGDCVIGARIAKQQGLHPGDSLFSSPDQLFDMAGTYPLKMHVRGILAETGTPDDDAIFVDLKTVWVIEGHAHGHDDLQTAPDATVLKREDGNVVGNAAVRMFQEITDANIASFHLHGDTAELPISAILFAPNDEKAATLLAGRFVNGKGTLQFIRPVEELDRLLKTLFRFESLALGTLALTGVAALGIATLVFALSFRMRRREFATLEDIGIPSISLTLVKTIEILLIGTGGLLLATLILLTVESFATELVLLTLQ